MKLLKGILFYFFAIIGIFLVCKLSIFYMPFLIGFIIAEFIEPIIKNLRNKTNLSRKNSSIIVVFTFFIILIGILLLGGIFIISETSSLLENFNKNLENITETINGFSKLIDIEKLNINSGIKNVFENTAIDLVNSVAKGIKNYLTKFLTGITAIPKIFIYTIITILATYFIASDKFYILDQLEYHLPKKWVGLGRENINKIMVSMTSYLKAQIIMILISFIIVLIGLNIMYFCRIRCKVSCTYGCYYWIC